MADWTIRVAQSPIGFGTSYKHNIIVVVDPEGRAVDEINGGPVGADGKIIRFNDRPSAYLTGDFPVGVEKRAAGTAGFYRPDLEQRVVFSGTEEQVHKRIQAADACMAAINSAGERYTLRTGPKGGRDDPLKPTFNSNSVNASLLQCMGIPVGDPAITSQPGYEHPILSPDQVQQIIEQQNPTAPPGRPPAGNIPIPRPQPQKRGDYWDNPAGPTFGQVAPSASPTVLQSGAGLSASSSLPQHVIDIGNHLRANGYEITPRTMYVSHVLGPQAAVDLFNRTGSTGSPAVPPADAAMGDQMRAWVRALRLGPGMLAGIAGGMTPSPQAGPAAPDQLDGDPSGLPQPLA